MNEEITLFSEVYSDFLSKVTDDMYISWTEAETYLDIETFLKTAIYRFTMPKKNLRDYNLDYEDVESSGKGCFNVKLDYEEINILSELMILAWLQRQLADSSLTRLNYSGADAKAINVKGQIDAIEALIKRFQTLINKDKEMYHAIDVVDNKPVAAPINLYGKKR